MANRELKSVCDIDGRTLREFDDVKLVATTDFESDGQVRSLSPDVEVTIVDMGERKDGKIILEAYLPGDEWWGLAVVSPNMVRLKEEANVRASNGSDDI